MPESENKNYVDLIEPIKIDGKEVKRLTFRRPKGKDLRRMDSVKGDHGKVMVLLPLLCNEAITPEVVDNMDAADVVNCEELVGNFIQGGATARPVN